MKHLTIIAFAFSAMMAGCTSGPGCGNSKEAFLQGYYQLIDEAKAAALPVSDSGWGNYDERFRAYVEECYDRYEPELSAKERRRFWAASMKYYGQRYGKGVIKELGEQKDEASEKVNKEVKKIWRSTKEALKEATGERDSDVSLDPDKVQVE